MLLVFSSSIHGSVRDNWLQHPLHVPELASGDTAKWPGMGDHFSFDGKHLLGVNQVQCRNFFFQGMGGQLNYFGLWIDSDYGVGKCSPSCTTYDSPMLSSTESFEIAAIEVWRVGPKPMLQDEEQVLNFVPCLYRGPSHFTR